MKALWTVDYVQNVYPFVSLYDDNEDQHVQPGDILNYEHKDEPSLDDWVYCEQFAGAIPNDGDAELPLNDLYALHVSRFL
jgi:hypothetical protein